MPDKDEEKLEYKMIDYEICPHCKEPKAVGEKCYCVYYGPEE